jgi:hypothetical protein
MNPYIRARNIAMVLAGVAALLIKPWFRISSPDLLYSYLANLSVSFSVYFLVSIAAASRLGRLPITALSLAIVEGFELTDGFGVMTNVYDPLDLIANVLGVALASFVDLLTARIMEARS